MLSSENKDIIIFINISINMCANAYKFMSSVNLPNQTLFLGRIQNPN